MNEEMNAWPMKASGQINFHCTCCGDCCRGVKESIMLESLDAFRLLRYFKKAGSPIACMEELYESYATPMPLNELGYPIFLLNTKGPQQACVFLEGNRCSVYEARPPNLSALSLYCRTRQGRNIISVLCVSGETAPFYRRDCSCS